GSCWRSTFLRKAIDGSVLERQQPAVVVRVVPGDDRAVKGRRGGQSGDIVGQPPVVLVAVVEVADLLAVGEDDIEFRIVGCAIVGDVNLVVVGKAGTEGAGCGILAQIGPSEIDWNDVGQAQISLAMAEYSGRGISRIASVALGISRGRWLAGAAHHRAAEGPDSHPWVGDDFATRLVYAALAVDVPAEAACVVVPEIKLRARSEVAGVGIIELRPCPLAWTAPELSAAGLYCEVDRHLDASRQGEGRAVERDRRDADGAHDLAVDVGDGGAGRDVQFEPRHQRVGYDHRAGGGRWNGNCVQGVEQRHPDGE